MYKRQPIAWSDADRILTIGPAAGELGVSPATRRVTVRVVGVAPSAQSGRPQSYDAATASLVVDLGDVATAEGATLTLTDAPTAGNDELARIEAFFLGADLDVVLKESLWGALRAEPDARRRLMVLEGFDLDAALRGVLAEILLANPAP